MASENEGAETKCMMRREATMRRPKIAPSVATPKMMSSRTRSAISTAESSPTNGPSTNGVINVGPTQRHPTRRIHSDRRIPLVSERTSLTSFTFSVAATTFSVHRIPTLVQFDEQVFESLGSLRRRIAISSFENMRSVPSIRSIGVDGFEVMTAR